jgi:hypothetical protein
LKVELERSSTGFGRRFMRCMLSCRDERRGGEMGPTLDGRGLRSRLGMAGGVVFYAVTLIVHSYTTPTKSYAFAHVCPDILEGIRRTQRTTTQALFPPESQALYLASLNHHLVHSFRPTPIRPFLGSQGSPACQHLTPHRKKTDHQLDTHRLPAIVFPLQPVKSNSPVDSYAGPSRSRLRVE